MKGQSIRRRGVLALISGSLLSGCLGALQNEEDALREAWEKDDEVPERDEVNRQSEMTHNPVEDEVPSWRPVYSPLLGPVGSRTNQHYEIDIEADDEIDVFVVEDGTEDDETIVEDYREGEFNYIPEYSAEGVQSHSVYVHVPEDKDYGLIVDIHGVSQERRHLEDPVPVDISIDSYYYLPFEVYRNRRTDD